MRSPAPPTVRLFRRRGARPWQDRDRMRTALFVVLLVAAVATA